MVIKTSCIYPPIPIRSYDWMAWVDGREEDTWLQGYGATEAQAIAELRERIEEAGEEAPEQCDCVFRGDIADVSECGLHGGEAR